MQYYSINVFRVLVILDDFNLVSKLGRELLARIGDTY